MVDDGIPHLFGNGIEKTFKMHLCVYFTKCVLFHVRISAKVKRETMSTSE